MKTNKTVLRFPDAIWVDIRANQATRAVGILLVSAVAKGPVHGTGMAQTEH